MKRVGITGTLAMLVFVFALAGCSNGSSGSQVNLIDGDLVIQTDQITTQASFYPAEIDGRALEVIAVQAPDGTIRTAFNTCQICYDSGYGYYEQDGDVLVCPKLWKPIWHESGWSGIRRMQPLADIFRRYNCNG